MSEPQCKSVISGAQVCLDGFPISAACFGMRCHACGSWAADKRPPACLSEDLGAHIIDETGAPRLSQHNNHKSS